MNCLGVQGLEVDGHGEMREALRVYGFGVLRVEGLMTKGVRGLRCTYGLMRYRVTTFIRNCLLLGPYSRPMSRALGRSKGGGSFL